MPLADIAQSLSERTVTGAAVRCAHCSLPVPHGLIEPAAERQFCCAGCRTVYEVIQGCGLDRYYALRAALADNGALKPAAVSQRRYAEWDEPAFAQAYVQAMPDGTAQVELFLENVHCAACVWLVEKLPRVCPGVVVARLNLRQATVQVTWDAGRTSPSAIGRALETLGYPPHPARDAAARRARVSEERRFLIRIAVAGALAGNVMLLAFALYSGLISGIEREYESLFRWLSMGLSVVSLAWPGAVFLRGAWAAIRTGTAHLDVPIALGILAGTIGGAVNTIRGAGEIYFDSITVLIFLLLVGRWIQHRQQRWSASALELLYSLTPTFARRIDQSGAVCEAAIESLAPGDLVEVRAGDSFPIDGVIAEGRSEVDQKLITGESRPVAAGPGERVFAGTINLTRRVVARVEAAGPATRAAGLMRLVEEASRRRAPIVQLTDRIGGRFVYIAIALAAITFAWACWQTSRADLALERAIALLIVTCPCALGLATPLALTAAIGRAAKRGILIKGGAALETLSRRGTIVLDKTGTMTEGRLTLVRWIGDEAVLLRAAALEAQSAHPIARAIRDAAPGRAGSPAVEKFEEVLGRGVMGEIDGRRIAIGSPRFVRSIATTEEATIAASERQLLAAGLSPVLIAEDGRVVALAGMGDPLRADARQTIADLRRGGWTATVLSGDHAEIVAAVAHEAGIAPERAHGGVSPESKREIVASLLENRDAGTQSPAATPAETPRGAVVMVGDGVNDAAALATADVGIAVHGGAEASLAAADVYIQRPGLAPIHELVIAARRTMRTIHVAIGASLLYNATAATLAITGLINPLLAAVLMPISSLTVLSIAFGGRTFAAAPRRAEPRPESDYSKLALSEGGVR